MKQKPTIVAQRLAELREGVHLSQAKLAAQFEGVEQSAIFRYENAQSFPPYNVLMQYAPIPIITKVRMYPHIPPSNSENIKYNAIAEINPRRTSNFLLFLASLR